MRSLPRAAGGSLLDLASSAQAGSAPCRSLLSLLAPWLSCCGMAAIRAPVPHALIKWCHARSSVRLPRPHKGHARACERARALSSREFLSREPRARYCVTVTVTDTLSYRQRDPAAAPPQTSVNVSVVLASSTIQTASSSYAEMASCCAGERKSVTWLTVETERDRERETRDARRAPPG